MAVHFVGFPDPRREKASEHYWSAVRVWGLPDLIHRTWDHRAQQEIAPGDIAVFAKGSPDDEPTVYSFDDSAVF